MPTVLHLIDSWGPGGAETVYLDVAEGTRDRGWTSLTAVPREGWVSGALRARRLEPIFTGGGGGWDGRHLVELVGLVRRNEVDLVQSHLFGSALYGGAAAKLCGVPLVATFHGQWDVREASGLRRVKVPIADRLCDRKVFVSEPLLRTYVDEIGMREEGAVVIENGIDTERFRPRDDRSFRHELGVGEEDFLVGSVGNVRRAKNHDLLLRVAALLAAERVGIHVVLVGEGQGPQFERLRRRRDELGLETRVHFAGFRDDVERVLNGLDAYVLTSDSEGFSLTTVQAMATGLPVVATRCGGPETLIEEGRTGFLVDRGDARAIAEVLFELRSDADLRRRLGERARTVATRRYSRARMLDGYETLYRDLLDGGNLLEDASVDAGRARH